ncbi:MAG: FAD-dependent oxidoreductase, partial [Gammaproteobacteria bacterium]
MNAPSLPARPTHPLRLTSDTRFEAVCDVLVVGCGSAGASAAIEAADAGASVIILEAASAGGGTTAMAGGLVYMGCGTPIQKACGFEDSPEAMYEYVIRASGPNADPERVRLYVDGSLAHYDWLIAQGMEYKPEYYPAKNTNTPGDECLIYTGNEACTGFAEHAAPAPRGHKGRAMGEDGGRMIMDKLIASATQKGVRIVCDMRAASAIVDDSGAVVGVVARHEGREVCFGARRGVVLCAGGFIMNHDMVARHAPWLLNHTTLNGNPNDDGSGIRIGLGAGAATMNMGEGFVCLPFYPPASFVEAIMVDGNGQRFINEDCYHGRMGEAILKRYPERHFMIVDAGHLQDFDKPPLGGFSVCATGDTAEELEAELGMPPGTLSHTIAIYNRHAAFGEDPLYRKNPDYVRPLEAPYAACEVTPGSGAFYPVFTLGGLRASA